MSLFGGGDTHHHSLLAGIGMGAAVVLSCLVLVLIDWHRAAGPVTMAITALACFVVAALAITVAGVLVYMAIWLRHKHRQFQVASNPAAAAVPLAAAQALPAPALGAALAPALQPAPAHQALPVAHTHVHLPDGMSPESVAAALRSLAPSPGTLQPPSDSPVEAVLPGLER